MKRLTLLIGVVFLIPLVGAAMGMESVTRGMDRDREDAREACRTVLEGKGWTYYSFHTSSTEPMVTCEGVRDGMVVGIPQSAIETLIGLRDFNPSWPGALYAIVLILSIVGLLMSPAIAFLVKEW